MCLRVELTLTTEAPWVADDSWASYAAAGAQPEEKSDNDALMTIIEEHKRRKTWLAAIHLYINDILYI